MNEVVDNLCDRIIQISDELDLVTIELDDYLVDQLGVTPLTYWPPQPPQPEKGIMIAGCPAIERLESGGFSCNFGLFTVIGIARTVSNQQITWLLERDQLITNGKIPTPPPNYDLGGISGGPLISWFESNNYIIHHCLSGIITEHPDYKNNPAIPPIERLIAIRADSISETGNITKISIP